MSDSGLLWLINRTLFHSSGLALAVHTDEDGTAYDWSLLRSPDGEWTFDSETDADRLRRAEDHPRRSTRRARPGHARTR